MCGLVGDAEYLHYRFNNVNSEDQVNFCLVSSCNLYLGSSDEGLVLNIRCLV
uniref:Uncharacterized protein n=1 Tax=Arundo donax TaxID=35708 RepID=A0A0A9EG62_ARUDO